jgi:hypothetical protein
MNVAAIGDDPIGARSVKCGIGSGGSQGKNTRARAFTRLNSRGSVFDYRAVGGRNSENLSAAEVGLGVWFPALDIAGGYQMFGNSEAGCPKADNCQRMACRGYDREAISGKRAEKFSGAWQGYDILTILDLGFFDDLVLSAMVRGG